MSMITELIERLRGKAKALRESGFNFDGLATDLGLAARVIENLSEKRNALQTEQKTGYISIADVMSVFDDFMCGEVDEDGTATFLEMLKDKAESECKE